MRRIIHCLSEYLAVKNASKEEDAHGCYLLCTPPRGPMGGRKWRNSSNVEIVEMGRRRRSQKKMNQEFLIQYEQSWGILQVYNISNTDKDIAV